MTGPLLALGVLSALGGAINLPELMRGTTWLHHWLEPVTATGAALTPAHALAPAAEWTLIGVAVAIAAGGIFAAVRMLDLTALVPAREAAPETGLGRILWRKWYVDELYDAVFVRPLVWLSRTVLWRVIDTGVVDGVGVNGAAGVSRALGWVGSKLQTGNLSFYVVVFVIGVVAVLWRALG
jgi:NADH-quinone oxidoreductase subunit L